VQYVSCSSAIYGLTQQETLRTTDQFVDTEIDTNMPEHQNARRPERIDASRKTLEFRARQLSGSAGGKFDDPSYHFQLFPSYPSVRPQNLTAKSVQLMFSVLNLRPGNHTAESVQRAFRVLNVGVRALDPGV
jgi:hypothetical protein